jgi:hypothetical protein
MFRRVHPVAPGTTKSGRHPGKGPPAAKTNLSEVEVMTRPKAKQAGPPNESPLFMNVPRWTLDRVGRKPTQRAVLFALCAYRNKGTGIAFPSVATLAEITGLSRRAVGVALAALVECEAIALARPWTQHMPNVYAIPDREPARQMRSQYASERPAEIAPDAHLTQSSSAPAAPETTPEQTPVTTTTQATLRSAGAVRSFNALAQSSSVADRPIYTNRRGANQRPRPRRPMGASAGPVPIQSLMSDLMERMMAKQGVA